MSTEKKPTEYQLFVKAKIDELKLVDDHKDKKYMELRPARPYLDSRHKLNASKTELVEMAPYSSVKPLPKSPLKRNLKKKVRFYPYALHAQMIFH
jgi:hypothetical protein